MKKYTLTVALKSDLSAEAVKKVNTKVEELVSKAGGNVEKTESLGIKPLAYKIGDSEQASFTRFALGIPEEKISDVRSGLERDDSILRVLVIRRITQ